MSCITCQEGKKITEAVAAARNRAIEHCIRNNEDKRAIVQQKANGAYTHLNADDARIGDRFTLVELYVHA